MEDKKKIDLFCIDCDNIRTQEYKGELPDGYSLYVCCECGCENTDK